MSETPPIPPGCECLVPINGELRLHVRLPDGTAYARPDAYWRPIIAAIARCAWLDEAERIHREVLSEKKAIVGWYEGTQAAFANAELWRKWGEEKP